MNRKIWERVAGGGALLGVLLAVVGVGRGIVVGQEAASPWLPWLGCWEAVEGGEEAPLLCIRPFPGGGVEFVTWAEGRVLSTEILQADGVAREVEREGCRGTETARFSADGRRVYLKASYLCGDGRQRSTSGILAVVNPTTWVDIKVAGDGVRKAPWALRYRVARAGRVAEAGLEAFQPPLPRGVREARLAAAGPLSPEDVVEAVRAVDAEAVEALIVEQGQGFRLDGKTLLALDGAGVPGRVVDVMVAVSYPSRFVVRAGEVEERPREVPARSYGVYPRPFGWSLWNPWLWDDPFFGYYGYWGYGVYPYGYGYGGWVWGGSYYRPVTVIIEPNQPAEAPERARMIRGQGATRGGAPEPPTTTREPTSGSGAAASSGGSSGGGSSSTGRTAVRRGGGGGN